jgi:peptidoglycan-associated lipoprotein
MQLLPSVLALLLPAAGLAALSAVPPAAAAQTAPRAEVAVTYDWVHTNAPPADCGCFSMNGGSGSFAYRFTPSFSVVGEAGAVTNGNVNKSGLGLTLADFLGGGRYTMRNRSRLKPFGEVLVGVAHTSGSLSPDSIGVGSATAFAMETGGGVDVKLSPHFALRAVQADYLLTLFSNRINDHQNNVRLGAGVVLYFGGK